MEKEGVEVIRRNVPTSVHKGADGLSVSFRDLDTGLEQMVLELFYDLIVYVCLLYRNNLILFSLQLVRERVFDWFCTFVIRPQSCNN